MIGLSPNVGIDRKMIGLGNSDDSQNVGIGPFPPFVIALSLFGGSKV